MDNQFTASGRTRGIGGGARPGVVDALRRMSSSQSAGRTFPLADRTLVLLIENGGVDLGIPELAGKLLDVIPGSSILPSNVRQQLVDVLREKILSATDTLLETFELTLNRYTAAKGSLFGDVVVLRDGTASYDELRATLLDRTRRGKLIDLFILTHGSNDYISVAGGIDGRRIRDLKTANGGPLSIRAVYMMNCVGSSLNQAWLDAGARASAGSIRNNYLPEPTMYFFWQSWKDGQTFEAAATGAYRKTVNLLNDAVRSFARPFPGLGALADRFSFGDLDFVRGSAPIIQGQGGVTITTSDLSFAKSLSGALATTVLPASLVQSLGDRGMISPSRASRRVSAAGLDFIRRWETFRAKLHNDAGGNCSIGYGTVLHAGPCDGRPCEERYRKGVTETEASELLARRVAEFQELVNERVTIPLGQHQYDALVSLASAIGGAAFERSTLLRLLNQGDTAAIPGEIRKWTRARGRDGLVERPDLVTRRKAEAELFATTAERPAYGQSLSLADAGSAIDHAIPGTLPVLRQPTPNTCWAAVFAMMYSWKTNASIPIRDAVATLGPGYLGRFDRDQALDAAGAKALYRGAGLESLESFNPTIDGWVGLLRKYGPLYVDVGYDNANANTHAIIVTAIAGDGSPANTSVTYVDPWAGSTVTLAFPDFLAKFEARSAVKWPYTIVHWAAGQSISNANGLPVSHSYVYESVRSGSAGLSRAQFVAPLIAGIEVADAAQIGLAAAALAQSQVIASQGAFTLTYDKADRLLSTEARLAMPGAKSPKQKYRRLILHLPQVRDFTAFGDVIAEWEGNAYGEIGTVVFRRDLAKSSEFSASSANIAVTWLRTIPVDGVDPRAWPLVYTYDGTFDPLANGYWEFHGELELTAFGGIRFTKHEVYSRSLADWAIATDPERKVQRGPDVNVPMPGIPAEQVAFLRSHPL
jgi:GH24 family phage-related lysozyme (muramidase)